MTTTYLLGIFKGEGIGPEVTSAAIHIISALEAKSHRKYRFDVRVGGAIGNESIKASGKPFDDQAIRFCNQIFQGGGAILAGPGGDRFVYECRREFKLFYKLNPVVPNLIELKSRRVCAHYLRGVDILVVRENSGGIYQGAWESSVLPCGGRVARHSFHYSETQVRSVAEVACQHASIRRGELAIVTKPNGIPSISDLWLDEVRNVASQYALQTRELEVDYAAFALLQHPETFDVIVTSNLFGDILSDLGGVLLGSRGLCYGASFSATGQAIYQTNHGAAWDIAGQNRANPVGHLLALAMAFDLSFQLPHLGKAIRSAVETVWGEGWRTEDLAEEGCRTIGTQEMAERIAAALCV